jgi:hypothetical protein
MTGWLPPSLRLRAAWASLLFVVACGARVKGNGSTADAASTGSSGATAVAMSGGEGGNVADAVSGEGSGATSGAARSGSAIGPEPSCPATFYPDGDGGCACASNAYRSVTITFPDGDAQTTFSSDGGTCSCEHGYNTVCTDDAGAAQCVNTSTDAFNCGGCDLSCKAGSVCNGGACSVAPTEIVAPAPGCMSIHLVDENETLYWADLGHGTLQSVSASGGSVTTMASGLHFAAIQQPPDSYITTLGYGGYMALAFPGQLPVGTAILVHSGTVYWIGAADTVTQRSYPSPINPSFGPVTFLTGGVGSSILSISPGGAPKVVLPTALLPSPSAAAVTLKEEVEGSPPPILSIALSPDAQTLYFGAGSRVYSIPSTGAQSAADVTYVGFVSPLGSPGVEGGWASALAADSHYVYAESGWWDDSPLEFLSSPEMCPADAGVTCPKVLAFGTGGGAVPDTLILHGNDLYWANGEASFTVNWSMVPPADAGLPFEGPDGSFCGPLNNSSLTGFAVGSGYAYFGEDGYVEKGATLASAPNAEAILLAREQPLPTSFALDGTNVYWTTSRCDIMKLADSPQ